MSTLDRYTTTWMDSYTINQNPDTFLAWEPPMAFSFTDQDLADVANEAYSWAQVTDDGHLYVIYDGSSARYAVMDFRSRDVPGGRVTYAVRKSPEHTKQERLTASELGAPWATVMKTGDYTIHVGDGEPLRGNVVADAAKASGFDNGGLPPGMKHISVEGTYVGSGPEVDLLNEARDIITGSRAENYGKAENSFGMIADLWTTYLDNRPDGTDMITAHDVAMMMALLKIARQTFAPKRDNLVDLAGYAALAQRITESGR